MILEVEAVFCHRRRRNYIAYVAICFKNFRYKHLEYSVLCQNT